MTPDLERTVAELVRQVEHRYLGKYRGIVVRNADPEHLGRLQVQVPSVLGDVVTGWALPCLPHGGADDVGWFAVPPEGAGVWVEFEEGDLEFPIWVGTYWRKPGGTSELPRGNGPDGAEGEVVDPPTRTILKTAKGHTIQIEDADGADLVLIHEATNGHVIALDVDGVRVVAGTGNSLTMSPDAFTVHSETAFTIDAPGQSVTIVADTIDLNRG